MATLKSQYENLEEVPESYRELFEEKDGRVVLAGVEGITSAEALAAKDKALNNARRVEKELKTKWESWSPILGERSPEDVQGLLDEIEELRVRAEAANGEDLEEKVQKLADAKIASKLAPLERSLKQAQGRVTNLETENTNLKGARVAEAIRGRLRDAAAKSGVRPTAVEDVLARSAVFEMLEDGSVVVKADNGFEPGLDPETWLDDRKSTHPHWWPESKGSGASGAGGSGQNGSGGGPKHRGDFESPEAKAKWVHDNGLEALNKLPKAPPQK